MSVQLSVGDTVLFHIDTNDDKIANDERSENVRIGIIKYIGYIHGYSMTEYVGIELVESVNNGHSGTINDYQYFHCADGYGVHTKITNVIRKLKASEVAIKLQEIINLFKSRLNEYVEALSERDEYIERLKTKQKYLRQLLKESESPSFGSVNTLNSASNGIILFNPHSININKAKNPRKSSASQFESINLTPMSPMTLTPRCTSALPPISNKLNTVHGPVPVPTTNKAKALKTKLVKKRDNIIPWNLNNDTFPDIEEIECNVSSKQHKTKDIKSPETDWTNDDDEDDDDDDDEVCDEYEDDCSFDIDYDNNIYSPYSTVCTSKASEYHKKKSPKISESKSYSSQHCKQYISTDKRSQQGQRPKIVDSKSDDIQYNEYMTSFQPQQQQQQYIYNNKTNMIRGQYMKPMRVPIYTLYLQPQAIPSMISQQHITTNGCMPLLIPSCSNQLNGNIASKSSVSSNNKPVLQQQNGWSHPPLQLQQHSVNHNVYKQPYYIQPQIDHWIQEKQRKQAQSQK